MTIVKFMNKSVQVKHHWSIKNLFNVGKGTCMDCRKLNLPQKISLRGNFPQENLRNSVLHLNKGC